MKELIDDTLVPGRGYYYLLDWNESDRWETMLRLFEKTRLCDLELHEYTQLFEIATKKDLESLKIEKT